MDRLIKSRRLLIIGADGSCKKVMREASLGMLRLEYTMNLDFIMNARGLNTLEWNIEYFGVENGIQKC